jgi:cytochrome P450
MSLDVTDLGPDFVTDPYSVFARLREEEPIRRVVWYGMPTWLLTRFADAQALYGESRLSAQRANAAQEVLVPWVVGSAQMGLGRTMIHIDPPDHTRVRRLVTKAFTPRRVEELGGFTSSVAEELVGGLRERGGGDVMREFSVPLTCRVIMALLGVAADAVEEFGDYTTVFLSTDPADQARFPEAVAWISEYIAALVDAKRESPGDDLLSALIAVREDGASLDEEELGSMMLLLLMAGFETTASLIGNGLLALLRHPDQLAAVRADLGLLPAAIEEMLRYDGAVLTTLPKFATEDFELGGVLIHKGDAVIAALPAANRDPRRFPDPDVFDVRRSGPPHLGFAHGMRYCLGAPLARLEARIAFEVLLSRCQDIRLAVPESELQWKITPNIRGLRALPVVLS